jgi:hypothetical protein
VLAATAALAASLAVPAGFAPISRAQLVEAMRPSTGYDVTATTNSGRFQAEVMRRLAETAEREAVGKPLFISHQDWYDAFLEVRGLTPERAPLFLRLSTEYGQDTVVEYRTDHVVESVVTGPKLRRALAVRIAWPSTNGKPESYSFEDLLSNPTLQVTNHREMSYRLLVFDDRMVLDTMEGVSGRPNSGALGLLFKLIGEGRVVEYRMAFAADGVQVSRGRARKALFEVETTVTIQPGGRADKDLPENRPDLEALERRLKEPLEIHYRPIDLKLY